LTAVADAVDLPQLPNQSGPSLLNRHCQVAIPIRRVMVVVPKTPHVRNG
jgi:hypothetical protein